MEEKKSSVFLKYTDRPHWNICKDLSILISLYEQLPQPHLPNVSKIFSAFLKIARNFQSIILFLLYNFQNQFWDTLNINAVFLFLTWSLLKTELVTRQYTTGTVHPGLSFPRVTDWYRNCPKEEDITKRCPLSPLSCFPCLKKCPAYLFCCFICLTWWSQKASILRNKSCLWSCCTQTKTTDLSDKLCLRSPHSEEQ